MESTRSNTNLYGALGEDSDSDGETHAVSVPVIAETQSPKINKGTSAAGLVMSPGRSKDANRGAFSSETLLMAQIQLPQTEESSKPSDWTTAQNKHLKPQSSPHQTPVQHVATHKVPPAAKVMMRTPSDLVRLRPGPSSVPQAMRAVWNASFMSEDSYQACYNAMSLQDLGKAWSNQRNAHTERHPKKEAANSSADFKSTKKYEVAEGWLAPEFVEDQSASDKQSNEAVNDFSFDDISAATQAIDKTIHHSRRNDKPAQPTTSSRPPPGMEVRAAQPIAMLPASELRWSYTDPEGVVRGTYIPDDMRSWFESGFFERTLPVLAHHPKITWSAFYALEVYFPGDHFKDSFSAPIPSSLSSLESRYEQVYGVRPTTSSSSRSIAAITVTKPVVHEPVKQVAVEPVKQVAVAKPVQPVQAAAAVVANKPTTSTSSSGWKTTTSTPPPTATAASNLRDIMIGSAVAESEPKQVAVAVAASKPVAVVKPVSNSWASKVSANIQPAVATIPVAVEPIAKPVHAPKPLSKKSTSSSSSSHAASASHAKPLFSSEYDASLRRQLHGMGSRNIDDNVRSIGALIAASGANEADTRRQVETFCRDLCSDAARVRECVDGVMREREEQSWSTEKRKR